MRTSVIALLTTMMFCSLDVSARSFDQVEKRDTAKNVVYEDWHDSERNRDIPIKIYLPTTGTAPFPVVIFSHGLGGSREAATYLGSYWSQHGYLCIFVQHAGSDTGVWIGARGQGREAILQNMKAAANGQNSTRPLERHHFHDR